jgi:hypothetical protein
MGFFSMCGYKHGKEIGEAKGNDNYLPITQLDPDSFFEKQADRYVSHPV